MTASYNENYGSGTPVTIQIDITAFTGTMIPPGSSVEVPTHTVQLTEDGVATVPPVTNATTENIRQIIDDLLTGARNSIDGIADVALTSILTDAGFTVTP